jgi:hypothetical protein
MEDLGVSDDVVQMFHWRIGHGMELVKRGYGVEDTDQNSA